MKIVAEEISALSWLATPFEDLDAVIARGNEYDGLANYC